MSNEQELENRINARVDLKDEILFQAGRDFLRAQERGEALAALATSVREDALGNIELQDTHINGLGEIVREVVSAMAEQFEILGDRYEALLYDAKSQEGEQ